MTEHNHQATRREVATAISEDPTFIFALAVIAMMVMFKLNAPPPALIVMGGFTLAAFVVFLSRQRIADVDGDGHAFAWERCAMLARWLATGRALTSRGERIDPVSTVMAAHVAWFGACGFASGWLHNFSAAATSEMLVVGICLALVGYGVLALFVAAHLLSRRLDDAEEAAFLEVKNAEPLERARVEFERRCRAVGMGVDENGKGFPIPHVVDHTTRAGTETFVLRLNVGQTLDDLRKWSPALETSIDGCTGVSVLAAKGGDARDALIIFKTRAAVTAPASIITWAQPSATEALSLPTLAPMPFGVELVDGELVPFELDISIDPPHTMIAGGSGGGKSSDEQVTICTFATRPKCRLHLLDGKYGQELGMWAGVATNLITTPEDGVAFFLDMAADKRRLGASLDPFERNINADERGLDLVLIDELANILDSLNPKDRKVFETELKRALATWRSLGGRIVMCTQGPRADMFSSSGWRVNVGWTIGCRTLRATDSRAIFDDDAATEGGYLLHRLPPHKGSRIVRTPTGFHRVFAPFIDDDTIKATIAAASQLRGLGQSKPSRERLVLVQDDVQEVQDEVQMLVQDDVQEVQTEVQMLVQDDVQDAETPENTGLASVGSNSLDLDSDLDFGADEPLAPACVRTATDRAVWDALGDGDPWGLTDLVIETGASKAGVAASLARFRDAGIATQTEPRGPWVRRDASIN